MSLACTAMGNFLRVPDNTQMPTYTYQQTHGHIIVMVDGSPLVLDTGSPFSVGYQPIVIDGRKFEVQDNYMDVCPAYLTDHIGTAIDGMIGADILLNYTVCLRPSDRLIEFSAQPPQGEIILPLRSFMGIPILPIELNSRVIRVFFDTGSPMSYLLPELLADMEADGQREDFYPLLGNFLTTAYTLPISIGGERRQMRFGELPEELRSTLEAGQVQGIIGTQLLQHFCTCFSLLGNSMSLDSLHERALAS